ncbi:MAG: hypothetical protein PHV43_03110, partial [Candidatus Colwellbacteria bacterium]|nr:hypothetical protein [Candidatus Colwellbacteria bacterium]
DAVRLGEIASESDSDPTPFRVVRDRAAHLSDEEEQASFSASFTSPGDEPTLRKIELDRFGSASRDGVKLSFTPLSLHCPDFGCVPAVVAGAEQVSHW